MVGLGIRLMMVSLDMRLGGYITVLGTKGWLVVGVRIEVVKFRYKVAEC